MKPPLGQRLRTLIGREHRAVLYARWFPRRIDRILLAVIAVVIIAGTVLRADVIGTNNRISSDEVGYAQNANEILADRPLATFKWAPGASLMFAAAAVLRGYSTIAVTTHSHGVAQYSQLLTELATLVLVALIAWIFAGPWAALLAVALMATYEPLIDITRTYLSEPLGGLAPMALMMLNVDFSGIGAGFLNMLMYILVAVFIAGLMVGRTPEYLGKKIESKEVKLAMLAILIHPLLICCGAATFAANDWGRTTVANPGPHGFSEILYCFGEAANNNGSAFAGLNANTPFYNISVGIVIWIGRFVPIIAALAIVGADDPLKFGVDNLQRLLPKTRVVVIDKAHHLDVYKRPEFVSALKQFLDDNRQVKKE